MLSNLRRKLSGGKKDADADAALPEPVKVSKQPTLPPKTFLNQGSEESSAAQLSQRSHGRKKGASLLKSLPSPWRKSPRVVRKNTAATFREGGLDQGSRDMDEERIYESENYTSSDGSYEEEEALESEASDVDGHRSRLETFYRKFNPEKLCDVDYLLEKYKGSEDVLFARLYKKYGVPQSVSMDVQARNREQGPVADERAQSEVSDETEEEPLVVQQLTLKVDNQAHLGIRYAENADPAVITLDAFTSKDVPGVVQILFAKPASKKLFGQLSTAEVFDALEELVDNAAKPQQVDLLCSEEARKVKLKPTYRIRDEVETKREWEKRIKTLDLSIFEVIDTERSYSHDLDVILSIVLDPIIKGQAGVALSQASKSVLAEFFDNWRELAHIHTQFYRELHACCLRRLESDGTENDQASSSEIFPSLLLPTALEGCMDVLDQFGTLLSAYQSYSVRYANALQAYVQEHQSNKRLQKFLLESCVGVLRGCSLETYLIKPIQRLCKYPLLLSSICSNLPDTLTVVENARNRALQVRERLSALVKSVDSAKDDAERISKLTAIHDKLRWGPEERIISLVEPKREFIQMCTVNARFESGEQESGVYHQRLAILCSDLLLLTVARKSWLNARYKVYDVIDALPLQKFSVSDLPSEDCREALSTECGVELMFSCCWSSTSEHCVMGFDSSEQHKLWFEALETCSTSADSTNKTDSKVLLEIEELTRNGTLSSHKSGFARQMNRAKRNVSGAFGKIHEHSAKRIQASFRGFLGRRTAKAKREEHARKSVAVVTIQKAFRRYTRRRIVQQ